MSAADVPRRRHWSDADKLRIVEESFVSHRQVTATARRHGISRSMLTVWRRQCRRGELGSEPPPAFIPMANSGVDVCGQVGTNWVRATVTTPDDIRDYCDRLSDRYQTPFHMAGMCLVEGLRELGAERIALNSVYYWPDWRDGIARFLRQAGFDLAYAGNFVDLGLYDTQEEVNDQVWIFPDEMAAGSMQRVAERAPDVDAYVVNGMPKFRRADGLPERMLAREVGLEALVGKPIVSSDTALCWRIFKTLGLAPTGTHGRLLSTLSRGA